VHAKKALVRRPSPRLAEGLLTHIERSAVDADIALKQWEGYVRALADAGFSVTEVEPASDCPDSVFVEDTVVVYGDLAVIARSGAVERRSETGHRERSR
jgi:dimethylargininase